MVSFLPTRKEMGLALDNLSKKEKIVFITLFLIAWVVGTLILIRLDKDYSTQVPANGGTITEGIVGAPRFLNPLLAVSDADRDLTRLLYGSLLKADGQGSLVPELAERYEVSSDGLTYTFFLKENLEWHDRQPLTARDIAFTVNLAKNPAIKSAKLANWEGVTAEIVDDRQIKFHLRRAYAPFLENTTLGILPEHIWQNISPAEFNLSVYNTEPIGSGPFQIDSVQKNTSGSIIGYDLSAFEQYKPEPPYLSGLSIKFYQSDSSLEQDITQGLVQAGSVSRIIDNDMTVTHAAHLPRTFAVFFNQDEYDGFKNQGLRNALSISVDRNRIVSEALEGNGTPTSLPIPPESFAYAKDLESLAVDIEGAKAALEKADIKDTDGDGIVERLVNKERVPVRFRLATLNESPELMRTAELIRDMWRKIGIDVTIDRLDRGDLERMINERKYEALLFGQLLGFDPDPYAFWHTSQRKGPAGLNIVNYANTKVDQLLEDARGTVDTQKRIELYHSFQEELMKDKPAVFLYSQLYLYATPRNLSGVEFTSLPTPQDRFAQSPYWHLNTKSVWNIFLKD